MKIALALERFDRRLGGEAIWIHGFAKHLLAEGHEVHIVACSFGDHELSVGAHIVPWRWSPLLRAERFQRALTALKPDLIYSAGAALDADVWQPHTGSNLHSLDRLIATEPTARQVRAALSPKMQLQRGQMSILERAQARRARTIIAVSPLVQHLIRARHSLAAHKVVTVMNGADFAHFGTEWLAPLRAEARRNLGVDDSVLFISVAHNFWLKGVDIALHALARLRRDGAAAHLAVAGGVAEPAWRRLAANLDLGRHVTFLGQLSDMRPLYAAADVLVHPTRWDACSLVVLEALAAGLPIVTTRNNGAVEMVEDGKNGLVLEQPESADALADLMRLLMDPARRIAFGAQSRRLAVANDIRANYRRVEQLLIGGAASQFCEPIPASNSAIPASSDI